MKILVVGEHDGETLRVASRSALAFARSICEDDGIVECLLLGSQIGDACLDAARFGPTLSADSSALKAPLADRYAQVIADVVKSRNVDVLVAASSTFSKDIVARAAGLLGGTMASDVVDHEIVDGQLYLKRPMYAGAVLATVRLLGSPKIVTVRASSYEPVAVDRDIHEIVELSIDDSSFSDRTHFQGLESKASHRPDVSDARVVVSGGRGIRDSDDFEKLAGGLADCLNGATGSSRALVDAGITPNDLQVGQTGKIVAPEVYVALGISGAVQHLAGMKNSKKIFAINKDSDAPIFQFADYGMVGDIYEIVPEIIRILSDSRRS